MTTHEVKLSSEFKAQTTKAIFSIIFFALSYLIILLLSVGFTVLCVYGGIMLIALHPSFFTLALGIGLASLGALILIFLLKFIFKSHKVDRSHLQEIKKEEEPELFDLINEIVDKVETKFPKRIYLSCDVNASVFYDSSFWSMIFPIKKNLQIGMGLVNSVTKNELKAILSHEFGHFSQKAMKVGSYVYNVNQIIFNMLYDNESYDRIMQSWANVSGYFSIFVVLAMKMVSFIQWILKGLYIVVNKSHMALSREMEFHADEIAATVVGYEPLCSSLLRMELADFSYNSVLAFYESKITENKSSANVYREQSFTMNFLAKKNDLIIHNELPEVSMAELNKFNKSRLIIEDQWASHPSTEERIERLEQTRLNSTETENTLANQIFSDTEKRQQELTRLLFKEVKYEGDITYFDLNDFQASYESEYMQGSLPECYNGYYDNKNPLPFEINRESNKRQLSSFDELFSNSKVNLVLISIAMQNDIATLEQIADQSIPLKTFDYDGEKFKRKEARSLIIRLNTKLEQLNEEIRQNDVSIFEFFREQEHAKNNGNQLENLYQEYFSFDKDFDTKYEIYTGLSNDLQFINFTTPIDQIKLNFMNLKPLETKLKNEIQSILTDNRYREDMTKDMKTNFDLYLSNELVYFANEAYQEEKLEILYVAMNNYSYLLSKGYFLLKKKLLNYQEELMIPVVS